MLLHTTLILLAFAQLAPAQQPFALKQNDRVVFFGDSITDQRLYTTFAETYVVTRFPKANISFVHSGWGGDRVSGGGGGPVGGGLPPIPGSSPTLPPPGGTAPTPAPAPSPVPGGGGFIR